MFSIQNDCDVFLIPGYTDMRKGILTLAQISEVKTGEKFLNGSLFIFCGKGRNNIKIVYWDRNGFCMWQKKLDKDKFWWPKDSSEVCKLDMHQLSWLLDGLNPIEINGHKAIKYELIA